MEAFNSRIGVAGITIYIALALSSCTQNVKITAPRYALVYGISNYQSGYLPYCINDAESMASALKGGNVNLTVTEREDSAVTKSQIKSDILSLGNVSSDSTIILYYSGHGCTNANILIFNVTPTSQGPYIVPYDAVVSTGLTSSTIGNLIIPSELESWLAQTGTKNVIIILDSCYSGGFVSSGSAIDASPQNYTSIASFSAFSTAISDFGNLIAANASASGQKSPIVLSAAGSGEVCWSGTTAMPHGVFTYYLLQTATNGDSNGDGVVTTTEAYAYTQKAIMSWDSSPTGCYAVGASPFLPHISGGIRDLVLFVE
jgi:uncharacterized caspase-like protein